MFSQRPCYMFSYTHAEIIVRRLAELGRTLSDGEILQLSNIQSKAITVGGLLIRLLNVRRLRFLKHVLLSGLSRPMPLKRRLKLQDYLVNTSE